jgi:hypothetical protein
MIPAKTSDEDDVLVLLKRARGGHNHFQSRNTEPHVESDQSKAFAALEAKLAKISTEKGPGSPEAESLRRSMNMARYVKPDDK